MGELEPEDDDLLLPCFCEIPPITRFLRTNKLVLLGGKGTGKTALFTLLKRRNKTFSNPRRHQQLLIPISTDIEYTRLRGAVSEVFKSESKDSDIQFRYFWEIYFLYRLLYTMREENLLRGEESQKTAIKFLDIFAAEGRAPSLIDFLKSLKFRLGVKVDSSNPAFPSPDFYMEPCQGANDGKKDRELDICLDEVKNLANRILTKKKIYTYIAVDNIDDFVAREDYEIQKMLVQGLLQCAKGFNPYSHIKVKLFLRTELYKAIDFSQVGGYEKIQTEQLQWTTADIWHFIGERILWNLKHHLKIEEDFYYVGGERRIELDSWQGNSKWWRRLLEKLRIVKKKTGDNRDSYNVSEFDIVFQSAMTCILPETVKQYDVSGTVCDIDLFDFLDSHFRLGNNELAPRLFIWYFQKVFELCEEYYRQNPEEHLRKDDNGEYPLIRRKQMTVAYGWLQAEVQNMFTGAITHKRWRDWLENFFKKKGSATCFSFKRIKKMLGLDEDQALKEFLAFLSYIGVLNCRDKSISFDRRLYDLPILLQTNWAAKELP